MGDSLPVIEVQVMKVLGVLLGSRGCSDAAVDERLRRGTACFWSLSDALCCPSLSLKLRLEEFARRVQPVVLFGAGAWTWSAQLCRKLARWENACLRRMVRCRRRPEEDFVTHIKRATNSSRLVFHRYGFESLATRSLKAIHSLAGNAMSDLVADRAVQPYAVQSYSMHQLVHVLVRVDQPSLCFLPCVMFWRDRDWWGLSQAVGATLDPTGAYLAWRHESPGKRLQWEDIFVTIYGTQWKELAGQNDWGKKLGAFIASAYRAVSCPHYERKHSTPAMVTSAGPPEKKARTVERIAICWLPVAGAACRLEFVGDSSLIIHWCAGEWLIKHRTYLNRVVGMHAALEQTSRYRMMLLPPNDEMNIHRHVYRELSQEADRLANLGHEGRKWHLDGELLHRPLLRFYFDGSLTSRSCSGGWLLVGSSCPGPGDNDWRLIASMCFPVVAGSITAAELEAAASAHLFLQEMLRGYDAARRFFETWQPDVYKLNM